MTKEVEQILNELKSRLKHFKYEENKYQKWLIKNNFDSPEDNHNLLDAIVRIKELEYLIGTIEFEYKDVTTKDDTVCGYIEQKGKKYLIPNCIAVMNTMDIRNCTCDKSNEYELTEEIENEHRQDS